MVKYLLCLLCIVLMLNCKSAKTDEDPFELVPEFTIAFGSCNKHTLENYLWDDVRKEQPDVWIWGGDNIYADTADIDVIRSMYEKQQRISGYKKLSSKIPVIGTWDDHDYGINDGGEEWVAKEGSQQAFLDFMNISPESPRRVQEGIYTSHIFAMPSGHVKIIVLDTRYFRTPLTRDTTGNKKYIPNTYGVGTILGETQWDWLENELRNSRANFNILVSSIQFLSNEHGFETWGNFPHEVARMKDLIVASGAKGVIFLSGDRHISECSKSNLKDLSYPLIDFTSSGLTHTYKDYKGEPNPYRIGEVVFTESFGLVKLNLSARAARFQIIGDEGKILGEFEQKY